MSLGRSAFSPVPYQGLKLRLRLLRAHIRLEAAQQIKIMRAASAWLGWIKLQRRPYFRWINFTRRECEPFRHDSNNGALLSIEHGFASHNTGIPAKDPLPHAVRNIRNQSRFRIIVLRTDSASHKRWNTQGLEQATGDERARYAHRLSNTGDAGASIHPGIQ